MAELMFAPEDRAAHVERRARDLEPHRPARRPARREVEMVRRGGERFPAEITVSRVRAEGRTLLGFFVRDISARRQQEVERAALYREQAARAEAEQMAGIVHGLQVLLDAALSNARLDDMLAALIPRLCEVLSADAATILLTDRRRRARGARLDRTARGGEARRSGSSSARASRAAWPSPAGMCWCTIPTAPTVVDPALRRHGLDPQRAPVRRRRGDGRDPGGRPSPRRFVEDDVVLLGLAADRVALAIDHARVFEREHKIAETLQRSLLPERLPPLPGLEVAARYLPAASEAEVGGDWYDVIPIDSGRVGLVMGDVAGKGLAAASMVGQAAQRPARLRAGGSRAAHRRPAPERAGVVGGGGQRDGRRWSSRWSIPRPGQVAWVNAGHPPPLAVGAEGDGALSRRADVPSAGGDAVPRLRGGDARAWPRARRC